MDPRAPLDDADPLEEDAPCLTIGQIDPKEEEALIIAMKNRAYDAITSYRADSYYRVQIPINAEAQIDYLINEYRSVFSSKLTGRPPCNIDPIRIPIKEGVTPVQSRARRYPPQKQAFLSDTCAGLEGENLVRPIRSAEWVAAPLLVPKAPPAMYRMTVDLRPINNATVKDDRPMPNMETMLLDVQKAHFFAQMDMTHAYFQVSIHPEDRHKHTFRGADSHTMYEPLRSLQGAKNSGIHCK